MPIIAEYIWIDADGNTRSKARTINEYYDITLNLVPYWSFDGSSTKQAKSSVDSEIMLKPIALFVDPFRKCDYGFSNFNFNCYMVLCECYDRYGFPLSSNTRYLAKQLFDQVANHHTWYGLEQEYVLYNNKTGILLGWPENGTEPEEQGKYYCGVGADRTFGRKIAEEHYLKCLIAGIKISGINEEVLPGQQEFQVGPCEGITAGDHLWMARYILHRVCEKHDVIASFEPKPVDGWNGSGMHLNFSTIEMRNENGIEYIYKAISKMEPKHKELITYCGDNTKRLTGTHETSKLDQFTFGVADRSASVRIPFQVDDAKCGYLEYRVPASDTDPYPITSMIAKTILLD
jgi:glutamine synthetase